MKKIRLTGVLVILVIMLLTTGNASASDNKVYIVVTHIDLSYDTSTIWFVFYNKTGRTITIDGKSMKCYGKKGWIMNPSSHQNVEDIVTQDNGWIYYFPCYYRNKNQVPEKIEFKDTDGNYYMIETKVKNTNFGQWDDLSSNIRSELLQIFRKSNIQFKWWGDGGTFNNNHPDKHPPGF